ncbi:hypothetical protein K4H28_05570 [Deefgea tanakiae]|jgi:hypothetical protein|uniref:Uncharacterized protein n=1 Tax=Deefgea tanakiae TaxID=2865840 RepID=A0ABX8ZCH7_9NEIS|nr:hypothetical protein [Deefgea tanakiae]QZA78870.1 hypothetical protein K4H28_05570 [Deefgea tanakiae]
MSFYFRPDDVPELQGLTRWDQRILLRGTFIKERAMSTVFLLLIVLGSVQYGINPIIDHYAPHIRAENILYAGILVAWLLFLMWARDTVMMNMLRPKIAIKRAEMKAAEVAKLEAERAEASAE